jgi:hypothetical protein
MPEPDPDKVETVNKALREGLLRDGSKYQGKDFNDDNVVRDLKKESDKKEIEIANIRQKNDNGLSELIYDNKNDPSTLREKVKEYISNASKNMASQEGVTGESNRLIRRMLDIFKRSNIKFDDVKK